LDDPEAAEEALLRESLKAAEQNAKSAKAGDCSGTCPPCFIMKVM